MARLPYAPCPGSLATTLAGAGGCDFLADPDKSADEAPVFWLPELHTATVLLAKSAIETESIFRFLPDTWRGELASRRATDGLHLILIDGRDEHRIWMPDPPAEGTPLAAIIPLDETADLRAAASTRFHRHITRAGTAAGPHLTRQRKRRLTLSLRALDGRLAGATYRTIAEALFGSARATAEPWKTASLRDNTIRLVRTGSKLMAGGYRDLLRGRPPAR
ncbi:MAG: DUF2285 domain-containing protein [Stellaceae bacterium]